MWDNKGWPRRWRGTPNKHINTITQTHDIHTHALTHTQPPTQSHTQTRQTHKHTYTQTRTHTQVSANEEPKWALALQPIISSLQKRVLCVAVCVCECVCVCVCVCVCKCMPVCLAQMPKSVQRSIRQLPYVGCSCFASFLSTERNMCVFMP